MKYAAMVLAAAGAFLLAGCASQPEELTFPAPAVTLAIQDSGKSFSLRSGQYAKISLKENPSTGYSWFFRLDTGKPGPQPKSGLPVELAGERFLLPDTDLVGAPGVREVMVRAVRPGTVYVVGNCVRPWEKDITPEQTVRYRFDVR